MLCVTMHTWKGLACQDYAIQPAFIITLSRARLMMEEYDIEV